VHDEQGLSLVRAWRRKLTQILQSQCPILFYYANRSVEDF
jgi:hypothetical protein